MDFLKIINLYCIFRHILMKCETIWLQTIEKNKSKRIWNGLIKKRWMHFSDNEFLEKWKDF